MSSIICFIVLQILACSVASANERGGHCLVTPRSIRSIDAVLDLGSKLGKEQKTAMEIAVHDFSRLSRSKLDLKIENSRGNSAQAVAGAMNLAQSKQVLAIGGTIAHNEETLANEINNSTRNVPILSLTSPAARTELFSLGLLNIIQMGNDITLHMRCTAAIVGEFRWRKVTVICEHSNGFSSDPGILTVLSHSLRLFGSEIDNHLAFPSLVSLSDPKDTIEDELNKLKSKSNRIVHSSLELGQLANSPFEKSKQMDAMKKGSVGVTTEGGSGLLDSVNSSVIFIMQNAAESVEVSQTFTQFKIKFRTRSPSRWYLDDNLDELSTEGENRFGTVHSRRRSRSRDVSKKRHLKIGVPAKGAFPQFVNVIYDQSRNEISITGFSIRVFKAAVKRLPYHLPYVFVPFNGSYDEMIEHVHKKELDGVVGDIEIMAHRYRFVEFSQPYVESGLDMVVAVKPGRSKETWMFLDAFTKEMWLIMAVMHISMGFVIWLIEREVNAELKGLGAMLWFLVTILFYAHREPIKSPLARIVLAPWLFVILIVTTSFTTNLTSMMTKSRQEPSVLDIQTLQRTNAPVGCNENSFVVKFLIEILKFKPENIRSFNSMSDYPTAFKNKDIEAAFFVGPHAKVFLAMYSCMGFIKAGNTFKLGGFGFVFQKGSTLAADISEALLNVIESGETIQLEKEMLSIARCSPLESKPKDGSSLGFRPFVGLFCICGIVAVLSLLYILMGLVKRNFETLMSHIQGTLTQLRRIWTWATIYFARSMRRRSAVTETRNAEETVSDL